MSEDAPDDATRSLSDPAPTAEGPTPGERIADLPASYVVDHVIGAGGMGVVFAAQGEGLDRPVAIKVVAEDREDLKRRFEREARVAARLQHPSIVPVYGVGRYRDGRPFYTMKQVSGRPLAQVIDEAKTIDARLALLPNVIAIADAVSYAHSKRIVHRDLKPQNVLVGDFGETVVIDWGLAKDLADVDAADEGDGPYRGAASGTAHGKVMGTPAYMPVEQARGDAVDERADVYSLGAILYHALAGAAPYVRAVEGSVPWQSMLARVLADPPPPIANLGLGIPVELTAIVGKAMARDRRDRYGAASELAADLRRFQTGQLVAAHRYTTSQRVRRWLRRHRAVAAVTAAAALILLVYGTWSVRRILAETDRAERERLAATDRANRATLAEARSALARDPAEALAWLRQLATNAPGWSAARTIAADALSRPLPTQILRDLPTDHAVHVDDAGAIALLYRDEGEGDDVWVIDLRRGVLRRIEQPIFTSHLLGNTIVDPGPNPIACDDGHTVIIPRRDDRRVELDLTTGRETVLASSQEETLAAEARCAARARFVADESSLRWWNPATGRFRGLAGGAFYYARITADRRHAVSITYQGDITWWGPEGALGTIAGGRALDFDRLATIVTSADGHLVVSADGTTMTFWDLAKRTSLDQLEESRAIAVDPAGTWIAFGSAHGGISMQSPDRLPFGHIAMTERRIESLEVSPDGRWLADFSDHGTIWSVDRSGNLAPLGHLGAVAWGSLLSGDRALTWMDPDTIEILALSSPDVRPGAQSSASSSDTDDATLIARSPNGMWLAAPRSIPGEPDAVFLVDARSGKATRLADARATAAAFSPDSQSLVTATSTGIAIWDLSGRRIRQLPLVGTKPLVVAFSRHGHRVCAAGDGPIVVADVETGATWTFPGTRLGIRDVAFGVDDDTLVIDDYIFGIRLLDIPSGVARTLLPNAGEAVVGSTSITIRTPYAIVVVPDDLPRSPSALADRLAALPYELDARGRVAVRAARSSTMP